jgi:2-polyprenyl-6-methoxyphenol hydroxylase-like FAD-dependent oxidoreductase
MGQPITIIGGGLAGLTLGIGLRQRGVPVTIREAGSYPRHRVCGEFISGRGLEVLRRLGLVGLLEQAGARTARTAAFTVSNRDLPMRDLPAPALCVSRYTLDARLAEEFRRLGGELYCESRWKEPPRGEGFVRATGRRARAEQNGWRWFGLKAHARHVSLRADLEMHLGDHSYVGLCRLAGETVNVCGLFRRQPTEAALPGDLTARLADGCSRERAEQLRRAEWEPASVCAIGGLPFRDSMASQPAECRLGDAVAMTPPVTGNGMSMAFESAELALAPLCAFAEGRVPWNVACRSITGAHRAAFRFRLLWAGWLQAALFQSTTRSRLLPWVARMDLLWRAGFRMTR